MNIDGIRKTRKAQNLTQKELASKLGISQATLSKYESGIIDPTLGQLSAIAKALNTTVMGMVGKIDWGKIDISDSFSQNVFPSDSVESSDTENQTDLAELLFKHFSQLNIEGQERLIETADDMVKSGKYKRSDTNQLVEEEA